eukprot:gene22920-biopygen10300
MGMVAEAAAEADATITLYCLRDHNDLQAWPDPAQNLAPRRQPPTALRHGTSATLPLTRLRCRAILQAAHPSSPADGLRSGLNPWSGRLLETKADSAAPPRSGVRARTADVLLIRKSGGIHSNSCSWRGRLAWGTHPPPPGTCTRIPYSMLKSDLASLPGPASTSAATAGSGSVQASLRELQTSAVRARTPDRGGAALSAFVSSKRPDQGFSPDRRPSAGELGCAAWRIARQRSRVNGSVADVPWRRAVGGCRCRALPSPQSQHPSGSGRSWEVASVPIQRFSQSAAQRLSPLVSLNGGRADHSGGEVLSRIWPRLKIVVVPEAVQRYRSVCFCCCFSDHPHPCGFAVN